MAIYEKNSLNNVYSVDMELYAKFVYDAPWPAANKNIYDTFNIKVNIDTNKDRVTLS